MMETEGSDVQKFLLERCKDEETKTRQMSSSNDISPKGFIGFRPFMNILSTAARLKLSRLQVMVIMSEAEVQDGMINYYDFIPVVSKTIELMFEPKTLLQRAELIEKTDLSAEALLAGLSSESFEAHLLTLFRSYDVNHDGVLDEGEFLTCLQSMELQLTMGEMHALFASADIHHLGSLRFADFSEFFSHNLLSLERERHIRILHNAIHSKDDRSAAESTDDNLAHISSLFKIADVDKTGSLTRDEFVNVLKSLELNVSNLELDILLSEIDSNNNGLIDFDEFLPVCTELLKV
jgi:Ca2+-binding EF-hand superfamily protein